MPIESSQCLSKFDYIALGSTWSNGKVLQSTQFRLLSEMSDSMFVPLTFVFAEQATPSLRPLLGTLRIVWNFGSTHFGPKRSFSVATWRNSGTGPFFGYRWPENPRSQNSYIWECSKILIVITTKILSVVENSRCINFTFQRTIVSIWNTFDFSSPT